MLEYRATRGDVEIESCTKDRLRMIAKGWADETLANANNDVPTPFFTALTHTGTLVW
jgi:hypothetical protein